jgi:hypothetical protein
MTIAYALFAGAPLLLSLPIESQPKLINEAGQRMFEPRQYDQAIIKPLNGRRELVSARTSR